tara:strand:- start:1103 stop:2083 length:981 start_codon:yes stop_codon:yes gene_type:complete
MKKKILIIGFGSIAKKLLKFLKKNINCEIAILRTSKKNSEQVGCNFFFKDNDALKFNPDYIFICSTANLHSFYFKKFKKLKANIFIEKPLLFKKDQIKHFEKYKYNSVVGYFLRFHPAIIYLKNFIKKNISKVRIVNLEAGYDVRKWRPNRKLDTTASTNKNLGGGALLELSHEIDIATWLFGYPSEIFCEQQKLSNLKSDVDDFTKIILNYKRRKTSILINLDLLQNKYSRSIKIILDNMVINFDYIKNQILLHKNKKTKKINFKFDLNDIYEKQIYFFLNRFKRNDKNIYNKYSDIISSVKLSKLLFQLSESSRLKKKLKFKLS